MKIKTVDCCSKYCKEAESLTGRLRNPNFADKAPPDVVAECQANLDEKQAQAGLARRCLADLS